MCGILGAFSADRPFDSVPISAIELDMLRHRGPNQQGWHVDEQAVLGFRRLSILDLAGGGQPLYSEDEQIVATVNGEIYNHRELRKQLQERHHFRTRVDGEVLIHLYEEHGLDFVHHITGMFAFALYDRRQKRLILGRDRAGKKPLFYRWNNGTLLYGSEIKPLLKGQRPPIHRPALSDYLRFGYVPAPLTILEGIYKLPPGTMMVADADSVPRTIDFWRMRFKRDDKKSATQSEMTRWSEDLRETLRQSVSTRLESEVPMGFLLSGGIDSASVFALGAKALDNEQVQAFTIGFKDEPIDESRAAGEVAERYQANHNIIHVDRNDKMSLDELLHFVEEPVSTDALLPTARVFQAIARANVTTVLSGEGADELFAGYRKFARTVNDPAMEGLSPLERYLRHEEFVFSRRSQRMELLGEDVCDARFKELERETQELDTLSQMLLIETRMRLPDRINLRLDRLSMMYSIEARAPFMDQALMEFTSTIPHAVRTGPNFDKNVLRRSMCEWLPPVVVKAKKVPFHAPDTWLTSDGESDALLSAEAVSDAGLVKAEPVQALRARARGGDRVAQEQVYSLYVLHAWHRAFYRKLAG
jgi:asparagine synthase (glutamine-hydrolysing)